MFPERNITLPIILCATLINEYNQELEIPVEIYTAKPNRFFVTVRNKASFDYGKLNTMLRALPNSIATYFAMPVADILPEESFQTEPFLQTKIEERKSIEVLRNRIYRLINKSSFSNFCNDLTYILYGNSTANKIFFSTPSNISTDKNVVIEYWTSSNPIKKEISMLGSGTLQTIEILLNLYHNVEERTDLNIVLLDEPDSHIHRDVQGRLLEVLTRVTESNQIILTTHNESMIRSASLKNLFHIDASYVGQITCMYKRDLPDLNRPHFKGLYPGLETALLQSLSGRSTGLDFINAIEADRIVFVEGEDDARVLYHLLMTNISNQTKKYVFWVLGGVSKIYKEISSYKTVLSAIKNRVTLWDKAVSVFDCDCMIDEHLSVLQNSIQTVFKLPVHIPPLYTMESVLLTNYSLLASLLIRRYSIDPGKRDNLISALNAEAASIEPEVRSRYQNLSNEQIKEYRGIYLRTIEEIKKKVIPQVSDIDLKNKLEGQYASAPLFRLAGKNDVARIINGALRSVGEPEAYMPESFCSLVQEADRSLLFDEWKSIVSFLSI